MSLRLGVGWEVRSRRSPRASWKVEIWGTSNLKYSCKFSDELENPADYLYVLLFLRQQEEDMKVMTHTITPNFSS